MLRFKICILYTLLFGYFNVYSQFQLNGSATVIQGDSIQLTPSLQWQVGSVWYKMQHHLDSNFSVSGKLYFGFNDAAGADGIVFVMQNKCLISGTSGGGIGYENMEGNSIGVEFDTWQNTGGPPHDPTYDHLALHKNGNINHQSTNNLAGPYQIHPTQVDVEDGVWYNFKINYSPQISLFQVYFDDSLRLSYSVDLKASIFEGNPFVYWGFVSATGGSFSPNSVYIADASFSVENDTICGGSTSLSLAPLSVQNIAIGKTAIASSNVGPAQQAIDGSMMTTWPSSSGNSEWIYVDLGSLFNIDSVTIDWVPDPNRFGEDYLIQTSQDAINWTTVGTMTGGDGGFDRIICPAINVRYVKMQGIKIAGNGASYDILEFRIYSTPQYAWSPNDGSIDDTTSSNPVFSPSSTTTYTVIIPDQCAGPILFDYTVVIDESGLNDIGFDTISSPTCDGLSVDFNKSDSSDINFYWVFSDGDTLFNNYVTKVFDYGLDHSGTLVIVDSNNCKNELTYSIKALDFDDYFTISDSTANIFSPNKDGINDYFEVKLDNKIKTCAEFKIYNRWGQLQYFSSKSSLFWDGNNNAGLGVPSGTYFYTVSVGYKSLNGIITLVR